MMSPIRELLAKIGRSKRSQGNFAIYHLPNSFPDQHRQSPHQNICIKTVRTENSRNLAGRTSSEQGFLKLKATETY